MNRSERQRFEDLAALCAAGAASPDEEQELRAVIAGDEQAAATYREFCDAGVLLARALPPEAPPSDALESLRQRVISSSQNSTERTIAERKSAEQAGAEVIDLASRRRKGLAVLTTLSIAAAAAMALLWFQEREKSGELRQMLAQESLLREDAEARERQRIAALTEELERAKGRLGPAEKTARFVRAPQLSLSTIIGPGRSGPTVKILADPDKRRWLVFAYELPPIPDDKDYQLWFISPDAGPISAGVLRQRPDGTLESELDLPDDLPAIEKAAISLERKGGAPSPTMDQIKVIGPL